MTYSGIRSTSLPPTNSRHEPTSPAELSTLLDAISSPAEFLSPTKAPIPEPSGLSSSPPSTEVNNGEPAAASPPPPPKRARGRPKGSKKIAQAERENGPAKKKARLLGHAASDTEAMDRAAGGDFQAANSKADKTDGIKKRGRPKKSVMDMKSSVAAKPKQETNGTADGIKKRGRPKKIVADMKSSSAAEANEKKVETVSVRIPSRRSRRLRRINEMAKVARQGMED
ncbi:MAG: hypothetical protein Q9184_001331 [Pyrenodesmia sp. 2 TL-2023]